MNSQLNKCTYSAEYFIQAFTLKRSTFHLISFSFIFLLSEISHDSILLHLFNFYQHNPDFSGIFVDSWHSQLRQTNLSNKVGHRRLSFPLSFAEKSFLHSFWNVSREPVVRRRGNALKRIKRTTLRMTVNVLIGLVCEQEAPLSDQEYCITNSFEITE